MPLSAAALEPLLRLSLVPGVGAQRLAALVSHFGSAERALGAPLPVLRGLPGVGPELARRIREHAGPAGDRAAARAMESLRRVGAVALTPDDAAYPEAFRVVAEPPFLLFAAGRLELLQLPGVALVGTRSPSDYGRRVAEQLGRGLAAAGYVVASGMARGIDAAAHAAALDAGGGTIGVLGHGIDQVYPAENRALFGRMARAGLLITEMPPGEQPKAGNFPRRNRLIAALSRAVVVVEMAIRSGAQHTVNYALEQGREVMAVPGRVDDPRSAGTNQLIREGARLVTSVEDVLEEVDGVGAPHRPPRPPAPPPQPSLPLLSPDEHRVLHALSPEPKHVDLIGAETQLPATALLAALLELELKGAVHSLPGKHFRRA